MSLLQYITKSNISERPSEHHVDPIDFQKPKLTFENDVYTLQDEFDADGNRTYISGMIRSAFSKITFTNHELNRLPHDMVRALFSLNMERGFGTVEALGDVTDALTPDVLNIDCALEIATSRLSASRAYKVKTENSYREACSSRNLGYAILAVSSASIITDISFSDEILQLIINSYSLGIAFQESAKDFGFQPNVDFDEDLYGLYNREFLKCNEVLKNQPESFLSIDSASWMDWSEQEQYDLKIYRAGLLTAKESVKKHLITSEDKTLENTHKSFTKYLDSIRSLPTVKHSKKLPVGLAEVKRGLFRTNVFDPIDNTHPLAKMWVELLRNYTDGNQITMFEAENCRFSLRDEEEMRASKYADGLIKEKHRHEVTLSDDVVKYAVDRGLWHKALLPKEDQKSNTGSTVGFDVGIDYSDYETWLSSWSEMMIRSEVEPITNKLEGLIDNNFPNTVKKFYDDMCHSRLGLILQFHSSVMSEINLNVRKPIPLKQFYVTRVPGFSAMLAIHNTGSDAHSFYMILVKTEDFKSYSFLAPFRHWVDLGGWMCSEISSTRVGDLTMQLSMFSKMLTILASTMDVFSDKLSVEPPRSQRECLFSLLVALENANQTSEFLQQLRFNYMQTNVSKKISANYGINVSKFPKIIYSRLTSFAIHKTILAFTEMAERRSIRAAAVIAENPEDEYNEIDNAKDAIVGVKSFISGMPLHNYEEALCLSYLGIYHNKDKSEKNQSDLQIFAKMVKNEVLLRDSRKEYMNPGAEGDVDPNTLKPHEFSGSHLRNCGLAILEHLNFKGISEDVLMQKLMRNWDSIFYEELATMKSSASMKNHMSNHGGKEFKDRKVDLKIKDFFKTVGVKVKAMENIMVVIEQIDAGEVRPFREMSKIVQFCIDSGGIIATLFKKNQLGGVREIFIITMISRIVIKFLESIARTIAEDITGEYLTKGTEKSSSTSDHYSKVRSRLRPGLTTMTLSESIDCATWCQNFVMPAFGNTFAVLTRAWPEMSNVVRGILNLVTNKRHELPANLMKKYLQKPHERSFEDSMNELKEQFLSEAGGDLNNGMSVYVKNLSNFMQGILHYVSTIIHAGHMLMFKKLFEMMLRSFKDIKDVVITTKCSSDDASMIITVFFDTDPEPRTHAKIKTTLCWVSQTLSESYPLMCAKMSLEKSTRFVFSNIEEFNSSWTFKNTILSIPTKFSFAAVIGSTSRSLVERQRLDHNLISSYVENGGTIEIGKVIELSCALQHYECLGYLYLPDEYWNEMKSRIIEHDHHSTMKYIWTQPIVGTKLGFDYTWTRHMRNSRSSQLTERVLNEFIGGEIDDVIGMSHSLQLIIGANRKYNVFRKKMTDKLGIYSLKNSINDRPEMLYMTSTTIDEVKTKILMKALTPGVARSFSMENYSLMHQSSAYITNSPCMTLSFNNQLVWERLKVSLCYFLKEISVIKNRVNPAPMMCPENKFFDFVDDLFIGYDQNNLVACGRKRKCLTKLHTPKTRTSIALDLLEVAKFVWFGISNGHPRGDNLVMFTEYQEQVPWLRRNYTDTVHEIMSRGYQENPHVVIYIAISHFSAKDRSIVFLCPSSRTNSTLGTLQLCLERAQSRDMKLIRPDTQVPQHKQGQLQMIESEILNDILLPRVLQKKNANTIMRNVITKLSTSDVNTDEEITPETIPFLHRKYLSLACIMQILKKPNQQQLVDNILKCGPGYIMSYRTEQIRTADGQWVGDGSVRVDTSHSHYILNIHDDELVEIQSSAPHKITSAFRILDKVMKRLRLRKGRYVENSTHGVYVTAKGQLKLSGPGRTSVPVNNIIGSRGKAGIELKVSPVWKESQFFSFDIYAKEKFVMGASSNPYTPIHPSEEHRWLKSEPVRFYPAHNQYNRSNHPCEVDLLNTLITTMSRDDLEREHWSSRNFVINSLNHRLARLGCSSNKRYTQLVQTMESKSTMDEEQYETLLEETLGMVIDIDFDDAMEDDMLEVTEEDEGYDDIVDPYMDVEDVYASEVVNQKYDETHTDMGELTIWDDWIQVIEDQIGRKMSEITSGNYRPSDFSGNPSLTKIIKTLIDWKIISEPGLSDMTTSIVVDEAFDLNDFLGADTAGLSWADEMEMEDR